MHYRSTGKKTSSGNSIGVTIQLLFLGCCFIFMLVVQMHLTDRDCCSHLHRGGRGIHLAFPLCYTGKQSSGKLYLHL